MNLHPSANNIPKMNISTTENDFGSVFGLFA